MITDLLKNACRYQRCCAGLAKAAAFVAKARPSIHDGRYAISGTDMYATVLSYRTKEGIDLPFEAHRRYIDVQCLLSGEERIDVAHSTVYRIKERYVAAKDVFFIYPLLRSSAVVLTPGRFALFFSHDFHRPGLAVAAPADVRKIVVKIRIA